MAKKRIRLTESNLRNIVRKSVKKILKENFSYTFSWTDNLYASADEMKYWGFNKEADMIQKFLKGETTPDEGIVSSEDIFNIVEDVYRIATEKYNSGEARHWDDYDDFIHILRDTIQSYLKETYNI